jgi:lipoprotein-releasing system permease protein
MYKLLLCWRYLLTRYLALVCIVSVMLGVATLIVVNSVMSGFSTKLRDRLHGLLSDVVIESRTFYGFPDAREKMERIRNDPVLHDLVVAMTSTVEVPAMMQFIFNGETITRPVHIIGIDPEGRTSIGGFADHLVGQQGDPHPGFHLTPEAQKRYWDNRVPEFHIQPPQQAGDPPAPDDPEWAHEPKIPQGAIVGYAIAHFRIKEKGPDGKPRVREIRTLECGDDIILTTVSGQNLTPVYDRFVVCDYFKSEMSEYDANYVFVPLEHLQHLRTMNNRVTAIQLKLKDYRQAEAVTNRLREMFPETHYLVSTWEEKQGPLLAAIAIERGLLNVLLFLIIAVAGFGILAIFSMIVVEKTRDIGILKALGASNRGVMQIFLSYGLLLGVVGAGLGTVLGLAITYHINDIEKVLTQLTGQEIFDKSVYYFDKIPTDVQASAVLLVNVGAVGIAVLFSVLPALRAAMLHPVRALRYE